MAATSEGMVSWREMTYVPPWTMSWAYSDVSVAERCKYSSIAQDFHLPCNRMSVSSMPDRSRAMAPPARRARALISLGLIPRSGPIILQLRRKAAVMWREVTVCTPSGVYTVKRGVFAGA